MRSVFVLSQFFKAIYVPNFLSDIVLELDLVLERVNIFTMVVGRWYWRPTSWRNDVTTS